MKLLGPIARCQVQLESLKHGEGNSKRYDPAPLTVAAGLILTDGGVHGIAGDGERLRDVHHRDHAASKNRGENAISIGFTGHYQAMRGRFGPILADGIAGENILVDCNRIVSADEASGGLVIETADGRRLELGEVIVAAPCVPFSRFAMQFPDDARPDRTVTETLQFLNDGMRGYYAAFAGPASAISVGDLVYLR